MTLKDAAQEVKTRWRDFLPLVLDRAKESVNHETSFVCPFCGHGAHGDGLCGNPKSTTKAGLICFSCGFSGSDIDLYSQMTGRDANITAEYVEVVKDMAGMLSISIDDQPPAGLPPRKPETVEDSIIDPPPERKPNTPGLYSDRIERAAADLYTDAGKDALRYLHSRGLTDQTIKAHKLGYEADNVYFGKAKKRMPAILFPHDGSGSYYSARSLQDKYFCKAPEKEAGSQPLFNPGALYQQKPCFLTESVLDALSIEQCGGAAASLVGTKWESVLMPQINEKPPDSVLVLALDNDPENDKGHRPGQENQAALAKALEARNIPYIVAHFSLDKYQGETDDPNSLMQCNADQLQADVARIEAEALRALKPDNTQDYILHEMQGEIDRLKLDAERKTGFSNWDAVIGSLHSGLHIIGGISSVGKSAFALQLADQLATGGESVLLYSMEMSRLEMVSRSISRYTRMLNPDRAVNSLQVRQGAKGEIITKATQKYIADVGDRISILEANFNCDVGMIAEYTKGYVARNKTTPTIIVDYLQVVQPTIDPQTGRKATDPRMITNDNITAFKRLSRELSTPVVVISSLNRANYTAPIDYESFRESSAIEYSADSLYGLELACMDEDIFTGDKNQAGKRARIKEAKREMPRKVRLSCLKNRYGISSFSVEFDYYPQNDYFAPLEAAFEPMQEGQKTPFEYEQLPLF